MFYTLPKIWRGRIKKYWDPTLPPQAMIPASSKFSLLFDTAEEKAAVETFKEELGTDDSVVNEFIPEGNFLAGASNVYDVKGEYGVKTVLSPEKVTSEDPFIVLHYDGEWKAIEDVELVDGYIWGVIPEPNESSAEGGVVEGSGEGFSPIAVVFYRRDMKCVEGATAITDFNYIVGNGNPLQISVDDNNDIIVKNLSSGSTINVTEKNVARIFGGSDDGSNCDSTFISVDGVNSETLVIHAGSLFYDGENKTSSKIGTAVVKSTNSTLRGITGGYGMCRINSLSVDIDNTKAFYVASGQTTITKTGKDANESLEAISMASPAWVENAKCNISNSEITWYYTGGNSGYSYTVNADCSIVDSTITGGIACGGSNGRSDNVNISLDNTTSASYESANRGIIKNVFAKIKDCNIPVIAILADDDSTATGIVEKVTIDMDYVKGKIIVGRNGGELATNADAIEYVKVSRSADYTIDKADLDILGDKFITK